ncbi:MAG TPA: lipid II flippase MurJ, partial [Rhodothermales bacterium]|nr:lipid II flippase MurJ [Rhodothermales bacterium]
MADPEDVAAPPPPDPDAGGGAADKTIPRPGEGPAEEPPGGASLVSNDAAPGSPAEAEAGAAVEIEAVEGARAEVAEGEPAPEDARPAAPKSAAMMVAAGILSSRLLGLVRERAQGYFFGLGPHADVLRVALKTPNFLQNLLGEGTISAAFIPIYSRMLEEGREEDAGRFAGAVFGLLLALVSVVVGLGVLLARPLLTVLLAGWAGDAAEVAAGHLSVNRFELAVATVKITFPMAGILVLSA